MCDNIIEIWVLVVFGSPWFPGFIYNFSVISKCSGMSSNVKRERWVTQSGNLGDKWLRTNLLKLVQFSYRQYERTRRSHLVLSSDIWGHIGCDSLLLYKTTTWWCGWCAPDQRWMIWTALVSRMVMTTVAATGTVRNIGVFNHLQNLITYRTSRSNYYGDEGSIPSITEASRCWQR